MSETPRSPPTSAARVESLRFVLRDRDSTDADAFHAVFEGGGIEVLLSAPGAPRTNLHCQRVIAASEPISRPAHTGPSLGERPEMG